MRSLVLLALLPAVALAQSRETATTAQPRIEAESTSAMRIERTLIAEREAKVRRLDDCRAHVAKHHVAFAQPVTAVAVPGPPIILSPEVEEAVLLERNLTACRIQLAKLEPRSQRRITVRKP